MKHKYIKITALFCLLALSVSCYSYRSYYETYFVKTGSLQYYLKKTRVHSSSMDCILDFTVRINSESTNDSTVNFSLLTGSESRVEKAYFTADGIMLPVSEIEILYIKKNEQKQRYTGSMKYEYFYRLMEADSPVFTVFIDNEEILFEPSKDFNNARKSLFMEIG